MDKPEKPRLAIDCSMPGGNIVLGRVEGDDVYLSKNRRDTPTPWIYWAFRVRGANGKRLSFHFDDNCSVGSRGAAYSLDMGKSWHWTGEAGLDATDPVTGDFASYCSFTWQFGPNDGEVWFSQMIPYHKSDWEDFLAANAKFEGTRYERSVLCLSRKGRPVEFAKFGRLDGKAKCRIFLTSRHHCQEASGSYVLEGLLGEVFSSGETGKWLSQNAEIRVVPFVDTDGVADGDQGKNRAPHDHCLDYTPSSIYPEVKAIMEDIRAWSQDRAIDACIDFHSPWLRGSWLAEGNTNEFAYQVHIDDEAANGKMRRFGKILEKVSSSAALYSSGDDLEFGKSWNVTENTAKGRTIVEWMTDNFPSVGLATLIETPFANFRHATATPGLFRAFGRDIARAIMLYLKGSEPCGDYPEVSGDCSSGGDDASFTVEAEQFGDFGGWKADTQFYCGRGSSFLLAHGLGKPVRDAVTTVTVEKAATYNVYALTRNWTAPWSGVAAGLFRLAVNGRELPHELGKGGGEWSWQFAGSVRLSCGQYTLSLKDLTGFDARCDAITFTTGTNPARVEGKAPPRSEEESDFVVCGGGIAGIAAAITAARAGLKVSLIHDRPVLGGANSSEVRVHLGGRINLGEYPRLGDVVGEIGPAAGGNAQDAGRYEDDRKLKAVLDEKNITLHLGMAIVSSEVKDGKIVSAEGVDLISGERIVFRAPIYADCTGDAVLGALSGARFRIGREGRGETGEERAPDDADALTMGSSVQWNTRREEGNRFPLRPWMLPVTEECCHYLDRGDWDWETGMNRDQLRDFEYVRDYGMLAVYSNWAYLKNCSARRAEWNSLALDWVAHVAGKRETRRLVGDYVLSGNDVLGQKRFEDGTCWASWTIDLHYPKPENAKYFPEDPFRSICVHTVHHGASIPFRSLYSKNISNLMMAGRNISVTHVALGTVRVMRTTGMMGEVVGMAAAVSKDTGALPREIYSRHLGKLKERMRKGAGRGTAEPPQDYNLGSMILEE